MPDQTSATAHSGTDRAKLAAYLGGFADNTVWADTGAEAVEHIETVLGWRPPARVITDPEELDGLPAGSVVLDAYGDVWALGSEGCKWYAANTDRQGYSSAEVFTPGKPMTVLHIPTEEAGRG
ncbi:hypothetical protein [Nocardia farcinica]|uniref:hypothetical protein n=1 Tax=Nocardia farcinica TaxID=37329 RepID=UPI0024558EEA|nr:hypothetical protein [Nocardia farcinica]